MDVKKKHTTRSNSSLLRYSIAWPPPWRVAGALGAYKLDNEDVVPKQQPVKTDGSEPPRTFCLNIVIAKVYDKRVLAYTCWYASCHSNVGCQVMNFGQLDPVIISCLQVGLDSFRHLFRSRGRA
jgi:hypothetical protein